MCDLNFHERDDDTLINGSESDGESDDAIEENESQQDGHVEPPPICEITTTGSVIALFTPTNVFEPY